MVHSKLVRQVIRTQREIADLFARFQEHLRSIFGVKDEETARDEAVKRERRQSSLWAIVGSRR